MRKRSLLPLDSLLNSLFRDLGIAERMRIESLRRKWCDIFAEPLSIHTAPAELKNDILVIAVDSPAWLQHLKFLKKEMAQKLAGYGIKDIRFKLGRVYNDNLEKTKEDPSQTFRELSVEDIARIEKTTSDVQDDELKDIIRSAMEKSAKRRFRG